MPLVSFARVAIRMARREARRHWVASLLVITLVGLPVFLLVGASTGLRAHEDFEAETEADARPWVSRRLRDLQGRVWLELDPVRLLSQPAFLDAGLE